jgi:hypothetical protein
MRHPGGGRPKKWTNLETFIDQKVQHYWECGAPITSEQLHLLVQQHLTNSNDSEAVELFVNGKRNTLTKFISRTLRRKNWSIRKITIS